MSKNALPGYGDELGLVTYRRVAMCKNALDKM
jgi:hypothetical protein